MHTHTQAKSAPQMLMHAQVETQLLTPKHQAPKCHRHQNTEQQNEPIVWATMYGPPGPSDTSQCYTVIKPVH